jgi:hypothetical protein
VKWTLVFAFRFNLLALGTNACLGEFAAVESSSVLSNLLESAVVFPFLGQNMSSPFTVSVKILANLVDTLFSESTTLTLFSTSTWSPFAVSLASDFNVSNVLAIVGFDNTFLSSAFGDCYTTRFVFFVSVHWNPFA